MHCKHSSDNSTSSVQWLTPGERKDQNALSSSQNLRGDAQMTIFHYCNKFDSTGLQMLSIKHRAALQSDRMIDQEQLQQCKVTHTHTHTHTHTQAHLLTCHLSFLQCSRRVLCGRRQRGRGSSEEAFWSRSTSSSCRIHIEVYKTKIKNSNN